MTTPTPSRLHRAATEAAALLANTGGWSQRENDLLAELRAALAEATETPTPGPYTVEYLPWPCAKDSHGEPNPPAAFICPAVNNEAIALVFGQGDDPFDSPSQRANANLFVEALTVRRACTAERLDALSTILANNSNGCTSDLHNAAALLTALRAVLAASGGGHGATGWAS